MPQQVIDGGWLSDRRLGRGVAGVALCGLVLMVSSLAGAIASEPAVFARVGEKVILQSEYEAAVHVAIRQRFFHGRADEARLEQLRHEVAGQLIDRVLLLNEAQRRQLRPDEARVAAEMQREAQRLRLDDKAEVSAVQRQQLMTLLRQQASERVMVDMLVAQVKQTPPPDEQEIKAFYVANLDKFTTPSQQRLSLILLKVAPSSPVTIWQAAKEEAISLRRRLLEGADFAELAHLHSADDSAEKGGDLGFVHQGMLAAEAQAVVDELAPGEVSEPVALLQGVALFKLNERRPAEVNEFMQVRARAEALLQRQRSEQAWQALLTGLRQQKIEILDEAINKKKMWDDVSAAKL